MEEALAHPILGYYRKKDPLGALGDFTTAPEISQMFGELVGLWCVVTWQAMGMPKKFHLVELGPGRGTLMSDALRAARAMAPFFEALSVHFVETSPVLRERQKEVMNNAGLLKPPRWHDRFDDVPEGPTIVIANEFFDALPIRQFQKTAEGWRERLVASDTDTDTEKLCFALGPVLPVTAAIPAGLRDGDDGSIFEICPAATSVTETIAEKICDNGGAALFIDYGHAKSGLGDTLQALLKHKYHDALSNVGDADLTAHVDFDALGQAAARAGIDVSRVVTQGTFLRELGIVERADVLKGNATPVQVKDIESALKRLIDDDQMGTLFKAMALTAPGLMALPGFGR